MGSIMRGDCISFSTSWETALSPGVSAAACADRVATFSLNVKVRGGLMALQGLDIEEGAEKIHPGAVGQFPHISSGPEAGEAMPAQA